jgi:hypothetical protein
MLLKKEIVSYFSTEFRIVFNPYQTKFNSTVAMMTCDRKQNSNTA